MKTRLSRDKMKSSINLDFCRLCQNEMGRVFIDENLGQTIFNITKIQIDDELYSSMPQNICLLCHNKIIDAQNFIDVVRKEDENMRIFVIEMQKPKRFDNIENSIDNNCKTNPENSEDKKCSVIITNKGRQSEPQVFNCSVCNRTYHRLTSYSVHKKSHLDQYCPDCNTLFENIQGKENHVCLNNVKQPEERKSKRVRETKPNSIMEIDNSEDTFAKYDNSDQHFQTENVNYSTEYTVSPDGNCFNDLITFHPLESQESHCQNNEHNEKKRPFLCVTCGKDFSTKNSLTCHEKIHSAIKGYKCEPCNIGFSVRSNLRAHIRKYHEGIRYYCSQCTKAFLTKCSLDRHEKIHTGIKDFKCEHCSSAFYTNKELVKHQRYHQGVKQHKCEECFKTFFERHHLIIHQRSHSGERPYVCCVNGCGKSFVESQKLRRHHKAKHIAK